MWNWEECVKLDSSFIVGTAAPFPSWMKGSGDQEREGRDGKQIDVNLTTEHTVAIYQYNFV